jgi:hypothetical protein
MSTTDLLIWVVLAGLASYKAAHMVSQDGDDGPFEIFKKWRAFVGTTTWIGKGFHCFSCTSFWGALIATILVAPIISLSWGAFLLVWGAVATIAFIVWRYFG